jgi:hypothetical protein
VSGYALTPASPDTAGSATYSRTETATCAVGKKVVGGGFTVSGGDSSQLVVINSYPSSDTVWSVTIGDDASSGSPGTTDIDVYAICVTAA